MRNIIFTAVFLLLCTWSYAQQEQQYSQFMFNKLAYNPAYAGSHSSACFTGLYRNQWIGLEGAPQTQALSFNMPLFNQRVGVGVNVNRFSIGINERWTVDAAYAYRVPVGRGFLGLGLQGSVRYLGRDYNDPRLVSNTPLGMDGSLSDGFQDKYVPNFGVGAYYNSERFYVGASIPRVILNNIDFNELAETIGEEVIHAYFMAGLKLAINDKIDFHPQVLLKYAENSPFDADLHGGFIFDNRFTAGLTYRIGGDANSVAESLDILLGAQITDNILLGLSYDIPLIELKEATSGSLELVLRYCLGKSESNDFANPRFF